MDENNNGSYLAVSLGICCGILLAEFWRWKRLREEELLDEVAAAPEFVLTSRGRRIPASHLEFAGSRVEAIGKVPKPMKEGE